MTTPRALLIDDDPWALELLSARLSARFPGLELETRDRPDCAGEFDVYLIDNDFHGVPLAGSLAQRIRCVRPEALIVAFSGTLGAATLRQLINAGCNGACDKSDPREVELLLEIVAGYLEAPRRGTRRSALRGAIHEIRALLREWNRRLDAVELAEGER